MVHSYDSTGIVETLTCDIPTLAFWHGGLDHVRDSAKPYYNLLIDAGIIHPTAESVAVKVNEIWDDVDQWWRSSEVQNARIKFCKQYARLDKKPVKTLRNIFLKSIP